MKHITQLADPCDTPPSLTMKHLYVALLKIIQTDVVDQEIQDQMRETLRLVEKSASGNENILTAIIEWLTYMDPKHLPPSDEIGVASQLIDWATATTVCRDELDANIEKLKLLKSENTTATKTLRSGIPDLLLSVLKRRMGGEERGVTKRTTSNCRERSR